MKILVVDDEELLVKGIRFNLQNGGYQVVTGSNGREAIELARDPDIRLIVLDVMMPEIDGLTAVSYTHLDVYKRQPPSSAKEMRRMLRSSAAISSP